MSRTFLIGLVAGAFALAGCKQADTPPPAATPAAPEAAPAASPHVFQPAVDGGDFAEMVKMLASDEFEGRGPGSPARTARSNTSARRCSASACSPATATAT